MNDMHFGITKDQLCKLAYEVAEKNGIKEECFAISWANTCQT